MKNAIAKILPIVVGVGLGLLLFYRPKGVGPAGPAGILIGLAVVFILLVGFIAFSISTSLPADVSIRPLDGPIDPSVESLSREIKALGFEEAGGPFLVEIKPAAALAAFVHRTEPVYATVFRTGTVPSVTSYDFVSIFEGVPGGLTTTANWRGGALPAGPGEFRQIIADAGSRQVFEAHLEGLGWLKRHGVWAKNVSAATFVGDFKAALAHQRRNFVSAPVKTALIALGRTVSRRSPDFGLLAAQKGAEARVRSLRPKL